MSSLRKISCGTIRDTVERLFLEASTDLGKDILGALKKAASAEKTEMRASPVRKASRSARIPAWLLSSWR
jgi:tartrate dehydratase alpha subunit/fumarate hydratase class I-like protein